ncbi:MAG TPA: ABC transporter substrate-binding protein, partial [Burkholderiaceae bacterium]|nr:ABC transporter substrate-binding protein [Burkholderiaceae bacterium]
YGDEIPAHPVGTGPFRLAAWRRSSKIVLERNPDYREHVFDAEPNDDDAQGQAWAKRFQGRRLPMIDRVEISIIEESQPRWLSFLSEEQDLQERLPNEFMQSAVPGGQLSPSLAQRGVQLYRNMATDVTLTVFNMEDPTVGGYAPQQVALRRAIGLGLDVQKEIHLVRHGQAVRAQSGIVPFTYGFDPNLRTENGVYDVARAKALLDTYGYLDRNGDGLRERPDGSPLKLIWATQPSQIDRQFDELRQKDMATLGLDLELRPAKWPDNLKAMRAGQLMIWSVGQSAGSPDSQEMLDTCASAHIGGQNLARFSLKRYDEISARTSVLPDGPERLALIREAQRLMTAFMPYKFYVHRIITDLAHPWLIGYRHAPYWNQWWQYVDIDWDTRV